MRSGNLIGQDEDAGWACPKDRAAKVCAESGKKMYRKRSLANAAAERATRRAFSGIKMKVGYSNRVSYVYACDFCGAFHLTRQAPK